MNTKIILKMIHYMLKHRMKPFLNYSSNNDIWRHYKNLVTLIVNMNKLSMHKFALLSNKYIYSTREGRKFYDLRKAEYLDINYSLIKALRDEINLLRIHGAESLFSRILYLAASVNRLDTTRESVIKHVRKLGDILTIPVPPQADSARVLDHVSSSSRVGFIVGSIYTWWILKNIIDLLLDRDVLIEIILFKDKYEDYVSRDDVKRLHIRELSIDILYIDPVKIDLEKMSRKYDIILNTNYLVTIYVIESLILNKKSLDKSRVNIINIFNPINTPLEEVFGLSPIIISLDELRNRI
ncbi:hypothetical protein [Staphylothermus hellenicus]|uniref:Uncharacterized protein n=1 Tax=Staphylothermus hellenicus (strain DSM 12710 / JCM 10830 / BK20S6-10-b1 / P8) TaxID=591019 RepID=D7D9C0_STAHD|nr:hypothetical protein [Staphylothermus hellenicus]ADI32366.1 hypothetical protein Shell_1271 [Staphylothermus hellenicus DSM 12710]